MHNELIELMKSVHMPEDLQRAQFLYQRALELVLGKPDDGWLHLALIYRHLGNFVSARNCYRHCLEIDPLNKQAWLELGNLYFDEHKLDLAIEAYTRLVEIDSELEDGWYALALAYNQKKQYTEAVVALDKCLNLNSQNADAWCGLGSISLNMGNKSGAQACYTKAVTIRPDFVVAWLNIANMCRDDSRWLDAVGAYRNVVAIEPQNSEAWNSLAITYVDLRNYPAAKHAFQQAVKFEDGNYCYHFGLGLVCRLDGQLVEAAEHLRRSISLNPSFDEARFLLATTLKETGHTKEATDMVQKLIARGTDDVSLWEDILRLNKDLTGHFFGFIKSDGSPVSSPFVN